MSERFKIETDKGEFVDLTETLEEAMTIADAAADYDIEQYFDPAISYYVPAERKVYQKINIFEKKEGAYVLIDTVYKGE